MSTPEQPGGDNPFAGLPFFGDLMRMMNSQGGSPWDAATQLAVSIATNGVSEPNVDPAARIELEEFSRIAEMHVEEVTGLTLHPGGRPLRVVPVTRGQWAQQALRDHRPLFERLSGSLGQASTGSFGADADAPGADPMTAMFGGIMKMMAPLMLGMTAGSMVGHLAEKAMGTYHLPLVRPEGADVQLVAPNIDAFAAEWEIDGRDLRMWVCLSELVHHAVLSIPHVRTRFGALLDEFLGGFRTDPAALEDALGGFDPMSAMGDPQGLQKLFGDPTALLGMIRSPAQQALLPQIEALVAAIVGYADHCMDQLAHRLLGSAGRLTEALRRRRVEAGEADRFVERLLGLELTQATYDRGAAFVDGVVERAGAAGLARLWERDETLPTIAEIGAPGLWLARIEFIEP
ncbi:MAG: zinc-dependent metalloprotease [Acidimicrobiia bacterium]